MPDGESSPIAPAPVATAAAVPCPECRSSFAPDDLGRHLHQVHKYQFFRGLWRSPRAAAYDALSALASAEPDPRAWKVLVAAATDLHGPRAALFLARSLGAALEPLPEAERHAVIAALTNVLHAAGAGAPLIAALASDDLNAANRLALGLLARLHAPLDPLLFQPAQALLLDRRLPPEGQLAVAAMLLRSVSPDDPRAADFLQALVVGRGRSRSIDQLHELERRAGRHPAIDAARTRLEEQLRMACSRCGAQLRRPEMIRHLWEEHRLVLEGRRAREPWSVIDDWLTVYLVRPDPELLDRCRMLAERIDPERGVTQVNRLMLRRGIADAEARTVLTQEAAEANASLCPACYARVPVPRDVPALAIYQRGGRLSARGYTVDVKERGLSTWLEVRSPAALIFRGAEPNRRLTVSGAALLMAGPVVLVALIVAFSVSEPRPREWGVVGLLGLAAAAYGLAIANWRSDAPPGARARIYAWTLLAPRLHAGVFNADDAAFLAGLADASAGDGYGPVRAPLTRTLLSRTERAVIKGVAPPSFLAPLLRLSIEDEAAGDDPVPAVAALLARCFEGKLPLIVAERLLADWRADWWTPGNLARLRVLLCDRAFGAGFEVRNLLDAGESSPALAEVLGTTNRHGLAVLRLLWSLRATRPWDRCGESRTVFELAEDVTHAPLLGHHPDLLLYQEEPDWQLAADGGSGKMGPAQIMLVASGVRLQGIEFVTTPFVVEVRSKSMGDELHLGPRVFRGPQSLDDLATRMERWFRFAFHEFLPGADAAARWQPPDRAALVRAWGTVPCPECGARLLAKVGEIGLALTEDEKPRTGAGASESRDSD